MLSIKGTYSFGILRIQVSFTGHFNGMKGRKGRNTDRGGERPLNEVGQNGTPI